MSEVLEVPYVLTTFGALSLDARLASRLGGKRLTFLAVLAAAGSAGLSRERVAALFWPESDAERSRAALKQLTYVYRGVFGDDVILAGPTQLSLNAAVLDSDVRRFQAAVESGDHAAAVAIQGAPFLDGIHTRVPDLERWIESTRARLTAQRIASLEILREASVAAREFAAAVQWAQQVVALDPGNSAAVLRLMAALEEGGRPADAVRVSEQHTTWLRVEYDLPADPTITAYAACLRTSASARPVDRAPETPADELSAAATQPSPELLPEAATARFAPERTGWRIRASSWPRSTITRAFIALSATALLVIGGARALGWADMGRRSTGERWPSSRSDATVAVVPFAMIGDSTGSATGDALMLLLVAGLDGTGGVHAVDVRAALRPRERRSALSLQEAAKAAHRLGAQYFILGDILSSHGTITVNASVYSSASPDLPGASGHASGSADEVPAVADSIAVAILAARGATSTGGLASSAARTTRSFPAFRAYLDGERALRQGRYGEAVSAFKLAVATDSDFALAHYRLSMAADWAGEGYTNEYSLKRVRALADRLPERERRLVLASEAWERGAVSDAERHLRRVLELFPGDPEAAYQLGEVLFHTGSALGRPSTDAGPLFQRVVDLEPENVEALAHLARVETLLGHGIEAESLSARVSRLRPADDRLAAELRTMMHGARGDRAWIADTAATLGAASTEDLMILGSWRIPATNDSLRFAEVFAQALLASSSNATSRMQTRERYSEIAIDFGDLAEALRRAKDERLGDKAFLPLRAYFVALPFSGASTAMLAAYADSLARWTPPILPAGLRPGDAAANGMTTALLPYVQGLVAARRGDTLTVKHAADVLGQHGQTNDLESFMRRVSMGLRAEVLIARHDLAGAMVDLDSAATGIPLSVRLTAWGGAGLARYRHAEILLAAGRPAEALRWYDTFDSDGGGELVFRVAAAHGRALALASLGRKAEAAVEEARARRLAR